MGGRRGARGRQATVRCRSARPQTSPTATGWEVGEVRRFEYLGGIPKDVVLTGLLRARRRGRRLLEPPAARAASTASVRTGSRRRSSAGPSSAPAEELADHGVGARRSTSTTAWYPLEVEQVRGRRRPRHPDGDPRVHGDSRCRSTVTAASFFYDGLSFRTSSTLDHRERPGADRQHVGDRRADRGRSARGRARRARADLAHARPAPPAVDHARRGARRLDEAARRCCSPIEGLVIGADRRDRRRGRRARGRRRARRGRRRSSRC